MNLNFSSLEPLTHYRNPDSKEAAKRPERLAQKIDPEATPDQIKDIVRYGDTIRAEIKSKIDLFSSIFSLATPSESIVASRTREKDFHTINFGAQYFLVKTPYTIPTDSTRLTVRQVEDAHAFDIPLVLKTIESTHSILQTKAMEGVSIKSASNNGETLSLELQDADSEAGAGHVYRIGINLRDFRNEITESRLSLKLQNARP